NNREAKRALLKTIALHPNHASAHYNLAKVWRNLGERAKADSAMHRFAQLSETEREITRLQRLITSLPDSTTLYRELAKLQYDMHSYEAALQTIRQGLQRDPEDAEGKALLSKIVAALTRERLMGVE
ncbi:MAG: tetratricopeptide repeat protein, partial [bacterium]